MKAERKKVFTVRKEAYTLLLVVGVLGMLVSLCKLLIGTLGIIGKLIGLIVTIVVLGYVAYRHRDVQRELKELERN